jgi:hypothetical protein
VLRVVKKRVYYFIYFPYSTHMVRRLRSQIQMQKVSFWVRHSKSIYLQLNKKNSKKPSKMQYLSWANPQTTHSEYNWVELEASHQVRLLTSFQHKQSSLTDWRQDTLNYVTTKQKSTDISTTTKILVGKFKL